MGMFETIDTSNTGLNVYQTWMDAISDNIANINTAEPTSQNAFQARYPVAKAIPGDGSTPMTDAGSTATSDASIGHGAEVTTVALGDPTGQLVYDPNNPMADSKGLVRMPSTDLGEQMTELIMAERGYQANLAVVSRATQAYQAALELKV